MLLGKMKDDRAGLEQREGTFLIGGDLAEGMDGQMVRRLHRREGHKTNLIWLPHFLERPAKRVSRASPSPPSVRSLKGSDGNCHRIRFYALRELSCRSHHEPMKLFRPKADIGPELFALPCREMRQMADVL